MLLYFFLYICGYQWILKIYVGTRITDILTNTGANIGRVFIQLIRYMGATTRRLSVSLTSLCRTDLGGLTG